MKSSRKNWLVRLWEYTRSQSKGKRIFLQILLALIALGVAVFLFIVIYILTLLGEIPDVHTLENLRVAQSTVIYDRDGNELYKIHGEENRKYIPLSEIADTVKQATIAMEDKDFFHHAGFDLIGITRSAIYNVLHPTERVRSGSTITQQLVKIVFLTPEVSLRRKLKELIMAYEVEQTYSKEKILELYLNQIPYGSNAYGIETAAQTFFGKPAKDLTLIESAILASLPNGPSLYSPYGQGKKSLMGYCKADKDQSTNEFSTSVGNGGTDITITVKAKEKVWLRVNTNDGEKKEELTLVKGDQKSFTASASLGFLFGSKNAVELSYSGFVFAPLKANNLVVTATTVRDFVADPTGLDQALLEQARQKITTKCASMDDPQYVKGRKDLVLGRMLEDGYITTEQLQQAWEEGNKVQFKKVVEKIKYPHFVMYVKDYLEDKYGQEIVEKGGLQVTTTLDPKLQDLGQSIIDKNIDRLEKQYKLSNMALLSANPKTGQILAMIGSRDYFNETYDGNVNITLARRQPGSSFKPFTYAAAFQNGYGAGTVLWDVKTQFGQGTPPNNADGTFLGPMTIRNALAWSRNIPAIKAYFLAGEEDTFLDFLEPFGFGYLKTERDTARLKNSDYSYGWPMGIGSVEVRMFDMVQGYAVFANGGVKKDLTPILEIKDKDGNIIEQYNEAAGKSQAVDPQVAYVVNSILSDVEARPAGYWRDRLTIPGQTVAAKTGTSNKRLSKTLILPSDDWTMGYSTSLVTGLWGGNADGSPMTGNAFDINTIAGLWKEFMVGALKDIPPESFPVPDGIAHLTVNKLSGKRVNSDTPTEFQVTDIFPSFGTPKEFDDSISRIKVDTRNNLLASQDCSPAVTAEKYVIQPHEVIDRPGWNGAIIQWVQENADKFPNLLTEAPTETSSLCVPISEDQKPSLTIVAPLSFGDVVPGTINVFVNPITYFGVDRVEYFWDDTPIVTAKERPYIGIFTLPDDAAPDSVHTIKAVLYDKNQYSSESTVQVKVVTKDTTPPHIAWIAPVNDTDMVLDTTIQLEVAAYDDTSSVEQVQILLDGSLVGTKKSVPYIFALHIPAGKYTEGQHVLTAKATDRYGNSQTSDIAVRFIPPTETGPGDTAILFPLAGATLHTGTVQPIRFSLANDALQNVTLIARRSDGSSFTLASLDQPTHGNLTIYWTPEVAGDYELFLKLTSSAGELSYSDRISVTVQ